MKLARLRSLPCVLVVLGATLAPDAQGFVPRQELFSETPSARGAFGSTVVHEGDWLAVSEPDFGRRVTLFRRTGRSWLPWQVLSFGVEGFGRAMALRDGVLAVGTPGFVGQEVYLFERDLGGPGAWGLAQMLPVAPHPYPNPGERDFGEEVALSDGLLFVADPMEATIGTVASGPGAVFVYAREGGGNQWVPIAQVDPLNPNTRLFGRGLAAQGDLLVVSGQLRERSVGGANQWGLRSTLAAGPFHGATIDGDTIALTSGSSSPRDVHVFRRNAGGPEGWGLVRTHRGPFTFDRFGDAVEVRGDRLFVGAPANAIAGVPGRVYVYRQATGGENHWGLQQVLEAPAPVLGDGFGSSLGTSTRELFVGVPLDSTFGMWTGAVHVLRNASVPTAALRPR